MIIIGFDVDDWLKENPKGTIKDIVTALRKCDRFFCGWSVADAEKVRKENWPHDTQLNIDTSHSVIEQLDDEWDASLGVTWDDLYRVYAQTREEQRTEGAS